jgi:hypothetical protein
MELAQQRRTVDDALRFRNVSPDEVDLYAIAQVGAAETERQYRARVDHEQHPEENSLPPLEIADASRERRITTGGVALARRQRPPA